MNINIITSRNEDWYSRQLSLQDRDNHHIKVNSHEDICWDMVVVAENLPEEYIIRCRKGGLVLITGEPPLSSFYSKNFLSQFDIVLTSHRNLNHPNVVINQQSLPWLIGLDMDTKEYNFNYLDFIQMKPEKTKNLSVLCSFKNLLPGHKMRNKFVLDILKRYESEIDCYGRGYKYILDKADAILPYRFHICVENSTIDNYWSEKFTDSVLGLSVPIYCGCTNIEKYFPDNSFYIKLDINNKRDAFDKIDQIVNQGESIYQDKLQSLIEMRSYLLNHYNIIPTLMTLKEKMAISNEVDMFCLRPKIMLDDYKREMIRMKFKRTLLKFFK